MPRPGGSNPNLLIDSESCTPLHHGLVLSEERGGIEPSVPFPVHYLSRVARSASLSPLHICTSVRIRTLTSTSVALRANPLHHKGINLDPNIFQLEIYPFHQSSSILVYAELHIVQQLLVLYFPKELPDRND